MNILVTGATGFIGQTAIRTAISEGHQVAALTRDTAKVPTDLRDSVRWLSGTLAQPPLAEIKAFKPAACLHSAWIATPGVYLDSPENSVLVEQTRKFANHLGQLGLQKFVSLGTCIEYAPSPVALVEDMSPLGPQSLYARSKVQTHEDLQTISQQHGFKLVWGRIFYPYGPGEHPARLISSFISKLTRSEPVILQTPLSVKDFIHIEDLANALLMLTEKAPAGTYNLCTGIGTSILELARMVARPLQKLDHIQPKHPSGTDAYPYLVGSPTKLASLGWKPRLTLTDGINRLLATTTV